MGLKDDLEASMQAEIERHWNELCADIRESYGQSRLEELKGKREARAMFVLGFCRGIRSALASKEPTKGSK